MAKGIGEMILDSSSVVDASPEPVEPMDDEGGMEEGLRTAAEDIMAAAKADDAEGFMRALKDFVIMCQESDYDEE